MNILAKINIQLPAWVKQVALAICYVLLGWIVHRYIISDGIVSIFWPGSGLALAALLIGGRRYIWGIFFGALILNAQTSDSIWAVGGITLANVAEAWSAYWLLTRNNQPVMHLQTLRQYLRLIAYGGGLASIVGAVVGALSLLLAGYIAPAHYVDRAIHWWMGDTLGVALVTTMLLAWNNRAPLNTRQRLEAALLMGITFVVGQIVFLNWFYDIVGSVARGYWLFMLVSWIAIRLGACAVTTVVMITAIQALMGAVNGTGFFGDDIVRAGLHNFWFYMLVLSLVGMALVTYVHEIKQALDALKVKDNALNAAANAIAITDTEGQIEWANSSFSQLTGYTLNEACGRNPRDLLKSGEHDDAFYQHMWETIKSNKVWRGELINRRKDGALYHEEMTITPMVNELGEISHYVAVKQDVTEQKLNDQRVAYSESLFRGLFEKMSSGVAVYTAVDEGDDFIFKDINRAVQRLENLTREDIIGKRLTEVFPDVKKFGLLSVLRRVWETGESEYFPLILYKDERVAGWRENHIYRLQSGEVVAVYDDVTARKQADIALQESHQKIFSLLNSMAEGAYGIDIDGNCTFVNRALLRILGYDNEEEVVGKHIHELIHHSYPDGTHYPASECRIYAAFRLNQEINNSDEVFWRKDGTAIPVEFWSQPIMADGVVVGAIATFIDITWRKLAEAKLIESESRLQTIIKNEPECIKIVDAQGLLTLMNPAGLAMIEADSLEQVAGHSVLSVIAPEYRTAFAEMHKRVIAGETMQLEFETLGLKGGRRWLETHAVPMQEYGKTVHLAVTRDITERKRMEEQVHQLAFYDSLTNLPNRRLLSDRLTQAIAINRRRACYGAVIFLDLDNFKPLNDTHGHVVGDLLLVEVADRLKRCVREMDTVARFGGDEFVVIVSELDADMTESIAQARIVAEKIRNALAKPYLLKIRHEGGIDTTVEHYCTASIGVALFFNHERDQDEILNWADAAMYQAKEEGRNSIRFYNATA